MQHLFDFTGTSLEQPPAIRHRIMGLVVESGWNPSAVRVIDASDYDPETLTLTIGVVVPEEGWAPKVEDFTKKGYVMPGEIEGDYDEKYVEHTIQLSDEDVAL